MKQRTSVEAIIVVVLIACGFAVWTQRSPAATPDTNSATFIDEKSALAQLQTDTQNMTPHFIVPTWKQGQTLTPEEKKIETDVATLMGAQYATAYPNNPAFKFMPGTDFWVNIIGKRYILITQLGADKSNDVILDSQTGQMIQIPGIIPLYLPESDIALNIGAQAIYAYSLDKASSTLVAGSELSGTETYNDGIGELGPPIAVQETHTKNSIIISVFDSSKAISTPDGGTMYTKIGQKSLSF
jgi:hypothetical protein